MIGCVEGPIKQASKKIESLHKIGHVGLKF